MRSGILALLFLIIIGVIVANLVVNADKTQKIFDALTRFWSTSINGLLARSS